MNKNTNKILLVYIGYSTGDEKDSGTKNLQLGQLYLGTLLTKKGYGVKLYSNLFPDPDDFMKFIREGNYGMAGFYCITNTIYRVTALVNRIKEQFPSMPVLLGGPHATVMDRESLENCRADLIIRHEGEYTFLEVAEYFYEQKGSLQDIKGITWRKGDEIIKNPDREFIKNLDELPVPDWHMLEGEMADFNHSFPNIITGRGCPFKCAFCYESFGGGEYRMRSAGHVIKEIELLVNSWNVKYIKFVDDIFIVNSERMEQICSVIKDLREKKYLFYWFCEARVDILEKRLHLLKKMREAGLAILQIGVESGNQDILDLYNKKITLEQIEKIIKACVEADIFSISINVIIGGPFETEEKIKNTTDFVRKLIKIAPGRLICNHSLLTPYPGTLIHKEPERFGLTIIDPSFKDGQTEDVVFMESEKMNKYDIQKARLRFEGELYRMMLSEIENLTSKQIEEHFTMTCYGIKTPWYTILSSDKGIKTYFNLKDYKLYRGFSEIEEEQIDRWCPQRTYALEYSGRQAVMDRITGKITLSEEETEFYKYSSGKLAFREIVNILSEKSGLDKKDLADKMIDFYKKMDNLYAIIWLKI